VGNDPTYNNRDCFETFPLPWPPGKEPASDPLVDAIADAARNLMDKRAAWLNPAGATDEDLKARTLTNLYGARPTWLQFAHDALDRAVIDAYGWRNDLAESELLERLFRLNRERYALDALEPGGQVRLPEPSVMAHDTARNRRRGGHTASKPEFAPKRRGSQPKTA